MAETMAEGGKGVLSSFKTKVGPFPLWMWTAVPAGGYVIYSYWKSRQTPDGPPLVMEDPLEGDEGAYDEFLNTGLPSIGAGTNIPGFQAAPDGSSNMPSTNDSWYTKALNHLVGQGIPALEAARALGAFIYGFPATITSAQQDIINKAVNEVGAPPSAGFTPVINDGSDPAPVAKDPPPRLTGLRVGKQSRGNMPIGWTPPNEPISYYRLEVMDMDRPGAWTRYNIQSTYFNFKVPNPGNAYKFKVAAVNESGRGTWASTGAIRSVK